MDVCQICSYNMMVGNRHYVEHCLAPELVGRTSEHPSPTPWKEVKTNVPGVNVSLLPLKLAHHNAILKVLNKERRAMVNSYILERLVREYEKPKLTLLALLTMRNPLLPSRPYFRQIWMGQNKLVVANTLNRTDTGVLRIFGKPKLLAKIVSAMHAPYSNSDGHFVSDGVGLQRILSQGGILKLMDGYFFAVGKSRAGGKPEQFEFGSGEKMLEKTVLNTLSNFESK